MNNDNTDRFIHFHSFSHGSTIEPIDAAKVETRLK